MDSQIDESFACTELEAVEKIARLQTEINEVTEKLQHKAQEVADQKTFAASLQVLASRRPFPCHTAQGLALGPVSCLFALVSCVFAAVACVSKRVSCCSVTLGRVRV
jgi:hypothetical protein